MADGFVRFRDKIYVPDDNGLKNLILREFLSINHAYNQINNNYRTTI